MRDSHLLLSSTLGEIMLVPSSSPSVIFNLYHGRGAQQALWTGVGARPRRGGASRGPGRASRGWTVPGRNSPRLELTGTELAGAELSVTGARWSRI
jgi:hypothetical protein